MTSIIELFEEQAKSSAESIAVKFQDKELTYQQLDYQANQLANYLLSQGATHGDVIGVCLMPSVELIVSILAVLKVGATFLPLDSNHPHKRLTAIFDNCNPKFIISETNTLKDLPVNNYLTIQLIALDKLNDDLLKQDKVNLNLSINPEQIAYIIHTSGSTGIPKGVPINQRGITKWLPVWQQTLCMSCNDTTALFPSVNFDAGIWDIFRALLTGGTLCLLVNDERSQLNELTNAISRHKVSSITVPPAILTELKPEQLPIGLKIISTGEAFNANIIQNFTQRGIKLFNGYGPTEVGVGATLHPVTQLPEPGNSVPIGNPIPSMQFYFLKDERVILPQTDIEGELLIGGEGITPGYLNLPEKTKEVFVPHPTEPNQYLYRTHDCVKLSKDGLFYYVGRITRQVKLHGQMINLDEIESCLNSFPAIRQSAVVIQERGPNNKILAAFYSLEDDQQVQIDELQQFLQKILPAYMVPCFYVKLDVMPLTSNGKIDRQKLAISSQVEIQRDASFVEPRGKLELALQKFWADVLGLEPQMIGARDSFWQLGGDSISQAKLLSKISDEFKVTLNLGHLKEYHTISSLAGFIRHSKNNPLVVLQNVPNKATLFCLPDISGHADSKGPYINLQNNLKNYTLVGLEAPNTSDEYGLCTNLDELAFYFAVAISTQQPEGPYYLIGYSLGATLAVKVAALLEKRQQNIDLLVLIDAPAPLLLEQLPKAQHVARVKQTVDRLIEHLNKRYSAQLQLNIASPNISYNTSEEFIKYLFSNIMGIKTKELVNELALIEANFIAAMQPNLSPDKLKCGKITLYCTQELRSEFIQESSLGWDNYFEELIDVIFIPGNHLNVLGSMFNRWAKHLADVVYKAVNKTSNSNNLEDKIEQRLEKVEKSIKETAIETKQFLLNFQSFFLNSCSSNAIGKCLSTSPEEKIVSFDIPFNGNGTMNDLSRVSDSEFTTNGRYHNETTFG